MEFLKNLLESMDGSVIEYCILGGIIVLVVILIASIVSCIKTLGKKDDKKRKYNEIKFDDQDQELDIDPIEQLITEANNNKSKKEDVLILEDEEDEKEEVVIASKIDIPEIIEEKIEEIEEKPQEKSLQKLDIKSITREMELKLEEEPSTIDAYEDEQEKTAIISYKELLEAAARIEANAENEEDYVDDVVFEFSSQKIVNEDENNIQIPEKTQKTKFIPTLDISPVFGKRNINKVDNSKDLFEIEEIDDNKSIEEEQFLKNLKKFRSNLD